jgi:hypothetical protein
LVTCFATHDGVPAVARDACSKAGGYGRPAFDRFAGLSGTTFQQLSAQTGIPLELLLVVREALGFAEPRPQDHVHHNELKVVPVIELQGEADLGSRMAPLIEQALLAVYHGQQEHAWSQGFVEHVEGALEAAGLYRRTVNLAAFPARSASTPPATTDRSRTDPSPPQIRIGGFRLRLTRCRARTPTTAPG